MATNATTLKNVRGQIVHRRTRHHIRVIAQKVLIVTVLGMIASLPVAGAVSGADSTRSFGGMTARIGRYPVEYELPHLSHTNDSFIDKRGKRQRDLSRPVIITMTYCAHCEFCVKSSSLLII